MAEAPSLSAGPLRLRPFGPEHLSEAYIGWMNDPEVLHYSENRHRHHDRDSCAAFVAATQAGPGAIWAIELAEAPQTHIGNITASIDPWNGIADIGILLGHPEARGRGYGLIAWRALLDHLCARPDLRKVTGGCMAANAAMLRIMENSGMSPDGCRKAHYLLDGAAVDIVYYARFCGLEA